eukprot:7050148-Lingulodinium_polyedra.AAC.1
MFCQLVVACACTTLGRARRIIDQASTLVVCVAARVRACHGTTIVVAERELHGRCAGICKCKDRLIYRDLETFQNRLHEHAADGEFYCL